MNIISYLRPLILLSIVSAAAITDAVSHKVFNSLLAAGAAGLVIVSAFDRPEPEPVYLSIGIGFIALLVLLHCLGMIGGADVKMYMLVILAYPDRRCLYVIILSLAGASVYAAFILAKYGLAKERLQYLRSYLIRLGCGSRETYFDINRDSPVLIVPMGMFIFAGALAVLLFGL